MSDAVIESEAYSKSAEERVQRMPRFGIRAIDVGRNNEDITEQDMRRLIHRIERTGRIRTVTPLKQMQARRLYCRQFASKHDVSKKVGVPIYILESWVLQFGWDEIRAKTEFRLYQRVTGIRRRCIPNIDEKHDQMFHNLESLIEDTIFKLKRDDTEVDPRYLTALAQAAKTCMEARRTIHKKEGPINRHSIEVTEGGVFNEFAAMLVNATGKGGLTDLKLGQPEEMKQIPCVVEDQEYEVETELEAEIDAKRL